jgi:V8-like Glu-specific endopeptidase
MRRQRTRLTLATFAFIALLPLAAVPVAARDAARAEHDRIVAHWTSDRIANATPRDFVKAGGVIKPADPQKGKPGGGGGGGSTSVTGASWTAGGPIIAKTGKVVFTMNGSDWICSGTVVDDGGRADYSMVLTAGHCAIDETTGEFATNWMFIPAFDTKPTYTCTASAYGCWTAVGLVVRNEFATAGAFNNQAIANDWALAIVGPGGLSGTAQLDATVGSYPLGYSGVATGDKLYAFGYPAAGRYHGSDLVYCAGPISQDSQAANLTWGMACNMTGGSSGGPWLSGFVESTGAGTLGSLNSYGYGNQAVMYGPKFNSRTQATYNAALTATDNLTVSGG